MDSTRLPTETKPSRMRPIPFLGSFLIVGLLFAMQQWLGMRIWYPKADTNLPVAIGAWELQYLLWGIFCWVLWRRLGSTLQKAGWRYIVFRMVPLSILLSVVVEMALTACFPQFPKSRVPMTFMQRLDYGLTEEFLENTAVFWAAFVILRAMGHYRESRQKERAMSQLAVELTEARMLALRMQINPHFLFNTMNSISSLMYTDVRAADRMLEQLSSMLRVSLQRGAKQLICLREEMEFIEMYLSFQDLRSAGRVSQKINIDPHLYDALIPTMLLQPLVENAYVHGLSHLNDEGIIEIAAKRENGRLSITVRNSGIGLNPRELDAGGTGIGLANIRSRLRLHFGEDFLLDIREPADNLVEVKIGFPLMFAAVDEVARPQHEVTTAFL